MKSAMTALAIACTVALGAAVPRRQLFGRGRPTARQSGIGVMVYHLNKTTGNCGDTNMTSGYMTSAARAKVYVQKASQYMAQHGIIDIHEGTCAKMGYHKFVGTTSARILSHIYTIKIYGKGGKATQRPNIVQIAVADKLTTLVAAVKAAGLASTLSGPGPFTVFAPSNAAFAKLGGAVNTLLEPQNKALLTKVLLYHVVKGAVLSTQLHDNEKVKTLEGASITVGVDPGQIELNEKVKVNMNAANIKASNGVIHVVDSVLLFPGFKLPGPVDDASEDEEGQN